jgi:hypothetical protein
MMSRNVRRGLAAAGYALLVGLGIWVASAAVTSWLWCQPRDFGHCLSKTLLVTGVIVVLPAVIGAMGIGALSLAVVWAMRWRRR